MFAPLQNFTQVDKGRQKRFNPTTKVINTQGRQILVEAVNKLTIVVICTS
jgi:hypothetical protein